MSAAQRVQWMHAFINLLLAALPGHFQVVLRLKSHPDAGGDLEKPAEFKGHLRADAPFAATDQADGDGDGGGAHRPGHRISGKTQRLHKILKQHVTRMRGSQPMLGFAHDLI
jgi:hypothetical protein